MKIILISGKARHGKTTVAELLKKKLIENDKKVNILYFSDQIKSIAKIEYGWNGEKDEKGRELLQKIGMEKRKMHLDYWIDILGDVIESSHEFVDFILIPDVRFKREIEKISSRFVSGVVSLRVIRKNFDNGLTIEQKKHPSEIDLDNYVFDHVVESLEGLNSLEEQASKVVTLVL